MSPGHCYDNAVAESFFSSLKKCESNVGIYAFRQEAKSDVFDYIEGFYNRDRSHLDFAPPADLRAASHRKLKNLYKGGGSPEGVVGRSSSGVAIMVEESRVEEV